ncbi:hemolysin III family protein [Mariniblastus sp.]|nr:hemolysin III family protein [Mariniblastus sp.]
MSSISHLVGLVIYAGLAVFMLGSAWGSRKRFWLSSVFCFTAVLMLTMSFVFHMFAVGNTTRAVMLRLDVAAIFLLIAGTFTPIHGILFTGWKRNAILGVLWSIAVIGITVRTIFFDSIPDIVGIGIFLVMGWIGALSAWLLFKDYGWAIAKPVVSGGVLYSIGAVINALRWPTIIPMVWGPHETFHLFVLAGLGVHWSLIAKLANGSVRPDQKKSGSLEPSLPVT